MSPSTTTVIEAKAGEARAVSQAEQTATEVAQDADVKHVEAVGVTGDPAAAIITAAREHHADVIVVGSHDSSWFHRLFLGSVRADVVRQADIPVLVVK